MEPGVSRVPLENYRGTFGDFTRSFNTNILDTVSFTREDWSVVLREQGDAGPSRIVWLGFCSTGFSGCWLLLALVVTLVLVWSVSSRARMSGHEGLIFVALSSVF